MIPKLNKGKQHEHDERRPERELEQADETIARQQQRSHRANRQFPRTRRKEIERRFLARAPKAEDQACEKYADCRSHPEPPRDEHQHRRQDHVVLFLERQRPDVQERLEFRGAPEIIGLPQQDDVGRERHGAHHLASEPLHLEARQEEWRQKRGAEKRDVRGRQQALGAAEVEIGKAKGAFLDVLLDDACDQESGDHEEDVDAQIAGGKPDSGVIKEDEQDRKSTQNLDICAERGRWNTLDMHD